MLSYEPRTAMAFHILALPRRVTAAALFNLATPLFGLPSPGLTGKIAIDFAAIRFVEPSGVTFLSNLIHWLEERSWIIEYANHLDNKSDAVRYLDDAQFFYLHEGFRIEPKARLRATTIPLQRISTAQSHSWLRSTLLPWLVPTLGMTEASLHAFETCVRESLTNIKDHSSRDSGSVFVQHYPKAEQVKISIADFGSGIPSTVGRVEAGLSDQQAILRAVAAGFSSKSHPRSRGLGLHYMIETVVAANGGKVTIFSGEGQVVFYRHGKRIRTNLQGNAGFCPGATIEIMFRTDTIEQLENEPEALEW